MAQMIYVEGLPEGVSVDEVGEHFGSIGVVKFDKKKNQKKVPARSCIHHIDCTVCLNSH